jgi:putative PIN family toxin of toxin-antitoxin system
LIVFDASTLVGAALKEDSTPERALLRAEEVACSHSRLRLMPRLPGFWAVRSLRAISPARRRRLLGILRGAAVWFEPTVRVTDCRDPKDDKYLELALAAGAKTIVSSDDDLLVLHPGGAYAYCARRIISCLHQARYRAGRQSVISL